MSRFPAASTKTWGVEDLSSFPILTRAASYTRRYYGDSLSGANKWEFNPTHALAGLKTNCTTSQNVTEKIAPHTEAVKMTKSAGAGTKTNCKLWYFVSHGSGDIPSPMPALGTGQHLSANGVLTKNIVVRFYLHEGTPAGADDWNHITNLAIWVRDQDGQSATFPLYKAVNPDGTSGGYNPGWKTIELVMPSNYAAGGYDCEDTPYDFCLDMVTENDSDTPAVTIDLVAVITKRGYGMLNLHFDACRRYTYDLANYAKGLGIKCSFATSRAAMEEPGSTAYRSPMTLRQLVQLHRSGHELVQYMLQEDHLSFNDANYQAFMKKAALKSGAGWLATLGVTNSNYIFVTDGHGLTEADYDMLVGLNNIDEGGSPYQHADGAWYTYYQSDVVSVTAPVCYGVGDPRRIWTMGDYDTFLQTGNQTTNVAAFMANLARFNGFCSLCGHIWDATAYDFYKMVVDAAASYIGAGTIVAVTPSDIVNSTY